MRIRGVILSALALALVSAGSALAQDPTGPAYAGRGPDLDNQVGSGVEPASTVGFLPFTGRDLALILLGALLLVGMGVLTRRAAKDRDAAE